MEIFDPHGSETPKWISMNVGIHSHVKAGTIYAKIGGVATTWVVSANT